MLTDCFKIVIAEKGGRDSVIEILKAAAELPPRNVDLGLVIRELWSDSPQAFVQFLPDIISQIRNPRVHNAVAAVLQESKWKVVTPGKFFTYGPSGLRSDIALGLLDFAREYSDNEAGRAKLAHLMGFKSDPSPSLSLLWDHLHCFAAEDRPSLTRTLVQRDLERARASAHTKGEFLEEFE